MSDHITMIDAGRVILDGELDSIKQQHHHSSVRFSKHHDPEQEIAGCLSLEGEGRSWRVIHETSPEQLRATVAELEGELIQTREATLQEIFIARVGRANQGDEP